MRTGSVPTEDHIAGLRRAAVLAAEPHLIAQGRAYDAATALEPLAETRPIDEEVHRALMLVYDAAGRRWDAVAVYESLRSRLDDEYAAVPDAQTTTLYRRLLTGHADALAGGLHHLVGPGTRFLGRRREIEELVALCTRNRLVTLSGPGGAGKTRLAVEVARVLAKTSSYADGLWMVDLSGVRDADLVPATAASALELTLSGSRPTVSGPHCSAHGKRARCRLGQLRARDRRRCQAGTRNHPGLPGHYCSGHQSGTARRPARSLGECRRSGCPIRPN